MADEWYYARAGQRVGPVTAAQLRAAYEAGQVTDADLVWTAGMDNWAPAGQVRDRFLASAPDPLAAMGIPRVDFDLGGPATHVKPVVTGGGGDVAGFWIRLGAAAIDWVVVVVLAAGAGCFVGAILGGVLGGSGAFDPNSSPEGRVAAIQTIQWAGRIVGTIVVWLYFASMEASPKQATLGKLAVGLRVTDTSGYPISFLRATGRVFAKYISAAICFVGFVMVAFTERKQGLHDLIAGTLVVRK